MTIIVGLRTEDTVYLGADAQGSAGWNSTIRVDPKVFIAHGIGYGFTSSYRMGQILRYHTTEVLSNLRQTDLYGYIVTCLVPMYRDILSTHGYLSTCNGEETGGTFLLAIDGRLFSVQSDFQVGEGVMEYDAVGCGANYALGSLFTQEPTLDAESRIRTAIEAAKTFSNGCGGDSLIIKLTKEEI